MSKHCQWAICVLHISQCAWHFPHFSSPILLQLLALVKCGASLPLEGVQLAVAPRALSLGFQVSVSHIYLPVLCHSRDGKMNGISILHAVRDWHARVGCVMLKINKSSYEKLLVKINCPRAVIKSHNSMFAGRQWVFQPPCFAHWR